MTQAEKDRRKRAISRIMAVGTIFVPVLTLVLDFYARYTSKYVYIFLFFPRRRQQPVTVEEALSGVIDTATSLGFLPMWLAVAMGLLVLSKPQTPYGLLLLAISSAYPLFSLFLYLMW